VIRRALLLVLAPIVLRILLIPQHPIPTPGVSDDFSYLLLADTLRHLRLANPVHPMHRFFETFFVLQEPSYSSIFPLGQGLLLALGGWFAVALSIGVLCALCDWMLRGFVTPRWALAGALLAAATFGPLSQWMNSFWGGGLAACAGCLVFGSLPRKNWWLLGAGIAVHLLTRPFETIFLVLAVLLYGLPRRAWIAAVPALGALLLVACQNHAVTKSWTTLPYAESRFQYGVPASFTTQPNPTPHRELTHQQQLDYDAQSAVHDGAGGFFSRWIFRIRYYRFFLLPPLYIGFAGFLFTLKQRTSRWIAATILLFSIGTNFYPYFYSHYIAALASLILLACLIGLQHLGPAAARVILFLCAAHFAFWYGLHAAENTPLARAAAPYQAWETWDAINHGDPEGRLQIASQLNMQSGPQLVFVRYAPFHTFSEWVHNAAYIDASKIVWARDLGPEENEKLLSYYPNRTAWLLQPDARPLQLTRYH
jgi:hypothetical protein